MLKYHYGIDIDTLYKIVISKYIQNSNFLRSVATTFTNI